MFKVNNENLRVKCWLCSKLIEKTADDATVTLICLFPTANDMFKVAVKTLYLGSECVQLSGKIHKPASIYLFKVNNKNGGKRYKICLKLTIKTISTYLNNLNN